MSSEVYQYYNGSSTAKDDFVIEDLTNEFKSNMKKSSSTIKPSEDKISLSFYILREIRAKIFLKSIWQRSHDSSAKTGLTSKWL